MHSVYASVKTAHQRSASTFYAETLQGQTYGGVAKALLANVII